MAAGFMYNVGVIFRAGDSASGIIHRIGKEADKSAGRVYALASGLGKLGTFGMLGSRFGGMVGFAGGLFLAQRAIRGIIRESARFEVANVQFEKLLGSAALAKNTLLDLRDFAARTPFEFRQSQEISKGLIAAGVAAKELIPTMRTLGDLGMGDPEKVEQLAYAYQKSMIAGKVHWRTLTMFATAGVPVFEEIKKQIGINQEQLESFVRSGKLKFPALQKALGALAGPGGKFEGMMLRMMGTQQGLWSTFKDNLGIVSQTFGGVLEPSMKSVEIQLIGLAGRVGEWVKANEPLIRGTLGAALEKVAYWLKNMNVPGTLQTLMEIGKALKVIFVTGLGLSLIAAIWKSWFVVSFLVRMGLNAIGLGLMKAGATGIATGFAMQAAWLPFTLTVLAIAAGLFLVYRGLRNIGLLKPLNIGGAMSGLGLNADEAIKAIGLDASDMTPEVRDIFNGVTKDAASSTIKSFSTSNTTSNVNLRLPPGMTAESDREVAGVRFDSYDLGRQAFAYG